MIKKIIFLTMLSLCCIMAFANVSFAETVAVSKTEAQIFINDNKSYIKGYNINGNNYFKLRDLASALNKTSSKFNVTWNAAENKIEIATHNEYTETEQSDNYRYSGNLYAEPSQAALIIDGKSVDLTAYNIADNNYYKLRDLAELIPFDVYWIEDKNSVCVYTDFGDNAILSEGSGGTKRIANTSDSKARWSATVKSYIYTDDNNLCVFDSSSKTLNVDTYDINTYELKSTNTIPMELDKFGGFYSGEKYNYIVFGQDNKDEDDQKVTFKTVKYTKAWQKVDEADYCDNNTIEPFEAGSLRMVEHDGYLYVRSSHKMYTTSDGLNHQSNITYSVDIDKMSIVDSFSQVMNISYGYVSHSFNQFIDVDGNTLVAADLGDAYPRGVVIGKYKNPLKNGYFISSSGYKSKTVFKIPGEVGANCTGVTIGGFEVLDNAYIAAINSIDHSKAESYNSFSIKGLDKDERDAIVLVTDKELEETKQIKLTDYVNNDKFATTPFLVKLSDTRVMVLWQELGNAGDGGVKYVVIDDNGTMLTDIKTVNAQLSSDCQPIFVNGEVIWYVNATAGRIFYKIAV